EIEPDEFTWIIDPVDGSDNFYRGILAYTIAVSLVRGDETLLGAVYEPYVDRLFFATKDGGATMNGRPLHVSTTNAVHCAVVAPSPTGIGLPWPPRRSGCSPRTPDATTGFSPPSPSSAAPPQGRQGRMDDIGHADQRTTLLGV